MKTCAKCRVEKPLSEFHNDKRRKDGKYPNCKTCHYRYMRDRYATNPAVREQRVANHARYRTEPGFTAAAKRRSEKHYQSLKGRATSLLRGAQRSPDGCTLTLDWIMDRIQAGHCSVTGVQFDLTNEHQKISGRAKNPYSPSLDRIEPKGSYSPDNVRLVIWQYNMMKGELTDKEFLWICERVVAQSAARRAA